MIIDSFNQQEGKNLWSSWVLSFQRTAKMKIKESEKIIKFSDLSWELKENTVEHEEDSDINYTWFAGNSP